jgi:hypothetical protein
VEGYRGRWTPFSKEVTRIHLSKSLIGRDLSDVVNFHLTCGVPVLGNSLDWKKKTPTTAAMEPSCQIEDKRRSRVLVAIWDSMSKIPKAALRHVQDCKSIRVSFQPKTGNPSELTMEMRNEIPQGELFPVTFFLEKSSSVGVDCNRSKNRPVSPRCWIRNECAS